MLVPQSYELRSSHREPRVVAGMVHSAAKEANPSYPHVFMLLQSPAPVKVTKSFFFLKVLGFCLVGSDRNLVTLRKHKVHFFFTSPSYSEAINLSLSHFKTCKPAQPLEVFNINANAIYTKAVLKTNRASSENYCK